MSLYHIISLLIIISAAFAYINHRFIKMPFVIGLFFLSTILSLGIISLKFWDVQHYTQIHDFIEKAEISDFILDILLGFLLFAGALHTNWANIKSQIKPIAIFAIPGVILSTILIGYSFYYLCGWFGINIELIYCLILGAIVSPTDPIAVLGILTKAKVSQKTESTIVGESLFNDGIGVVVFVALLHTLNHKSDGIDLVFFGKLFAQEALGGGIIGAILGFTLHRLLRSIDDYETEVLLTIAFVMGGYWMCNFIHISGPLAMVIMGLLVGNYKKSKAMSDVTQEYIGKFWELFDVILNALLFITIAFIIIVIDINVTYLIISLITIFIVLLSRIIVVFLPKLLLPRIVQITNSEAKIIIWGGLRGGLSIALVLSLPVSPQRDLLILITYVIVVVSILVQGMTIERLVRKLK